jgi:hypothetical protein
MVLVTSNKQQQLLCVSYVQRVVPSELVNTRGDLEALLADLSPGFRFLGDMTHLEYMDPDCATEIGKVMELLDKKEIGLLVRVIPDPSKDIGMKILSIFHFKRQPRVINCESLAEALQKLSIWK